MTTLTLCAPLPAEDTHPDSQPPNVTPLPVPDADRPAAARYLIAHGFTALDVWHLGLDADLAAAMWMLEANTP